MVLTARDFVAELEIFHELKQLIPHVGIFILLPNGIELLTGEAAKVLTNFFGI